MFVKLQRNVGENGLTALEGLVFAIKGSPLHLLGSPELLCFLQIFLHLWVHIKWLSQFLFRMTCFFCPRVAICFLHQLMPEL